MILTQVLISLNFRKLIFRGQVLDCAGGGTEAPVLDFGWEEEVVDVVEEAVVDEVGY